MDSGTPKTLDRRDFLKKTASVSLAAATLGISSAARAEAGTREEV
jgi:uncharacterized protein (DUF1501 family)